MVNIEKTKDTFYYKVKKKFIRLSIIVRTIFKYLLIFLLLFTIIVLIMLYFSLKLQLEELENVIPSLEKVYEGTAQGTTLESAHWYPQIGKFLGPEEAKTESGEENDTKLNQIKDKRLILINADKLTEFRNKLLFLHGVNYLTDLVTDEKLKQAVERTGACTGQYSRAFSGHHWVYFLIVSKEDYDYIMDYKIGNIIEDFNNTVKKEYAGHIEKNLPNKILLNFLNNRDFPVHQKAFFRNAGTRNVIRDWYSWEYYYKLKN